MIGHLGTRVSALLDGQLSPAEAERAWAHVHLCHLCRDLVEREGWVKTRLAGLSAGSAPDHLRGSLRGSLPSPGAVPAWPQVISTGSSGAAAPRRPMGRVAIGGGAAGAAMVGLLVLGVGQSDSPTDRRPPVTSIRQSETPAPVPTLRRPTLP